LPIFFALYRLLMGAIDLRGESFLWINDLTAPDALFTFPFSLPILGNKFNILPILMGLSQLVAQRLQSTNMSDPNQKMMATAMPIIFIFILYNFPAGLSLYWFISNLWQIIFQVFVNKKVREEVEKKVHQKFEERQKTGFPAKDKSESKDPGWRDNFMKWLEKKAKDAEKTKKRK
ncbi:MAG: YidC/Oxa1 family membrane protein insertase, partial [Candidatus Sumerlaeota bacterium]